MASRIHAIIVTYHPLIEKLGDLLDALEDQVDAVIVVDNASSADVRSWLEQSAGARELQLLLLPRNVGVAAAHNLGMDRARERGADAVLLLDQDSIPNPDMVVLLRNALRHLTDTGEAVAVVGPTHVDRVTREQAPFVRYGFPRNQHLSCNTAANEPVIECDHLITSGSLIPLDVVNRVGGMDEELFVDNVDTEWCFRAMAHGFKVYGVCGAEMMHSLGEGHVKTWIPGMPAVVIHGPLRLYYVIRNRLLLYRRKETPARWVLQDIPRAIYKFGVFATTIAPRAKNLSMMLKGITHGIIGRAGPYRDA